MKSSFINIVLTLITLSRCHSFDVRKQVNNGTDPLIYPLSSKYLLVSLTANTTVPCIVEGITPSNTSFVLVQAHSQSHNIVLSTNKNFSSGGYVNSTNGGIIVDVTDTQNECKEAQCEIYLTNIHPQEISVLIFATPYSSYDPIPGGGLISNNSIAHPYLDVQSTILTINATIPQACSNLSEESSNTSYNLLYEVFLTYMYEGDMNEAQYWEVLIDTSTPEGLRKYATKVAEFSSDNSSLPISPYLFVSYTGVGTVISVVVSNVDVSVTQGVYVPGSSLPLTNGTLYSSFVSYGCDFIPGEAYRCSKLINPLTEVFVASLLFVGLILSTLGHRWLNFTMFTSGFFAAWLILFLIFVQIPRANIHALGTGTFLGSLVCGVAWLLVWHIFRRPLQSSLPIIIGTAYLVAMIATHITKYAVYTSTSNIAMYIVFPLIFTVIMVGYSIKNIKAVHIFSCVTLGSYATILPFSFYLGSTLNYIVINAVASMTVPGYASAVGYPPFQKSDLAIMALWSVVAAVGFTIQLYRERNSPPFYPPNLQYWRATKNAGKFLYESTFKCCYRMTTCSRYYDTPESNTDDRVPQGEYQRVSDSNGVGVSVADGILDSATEHFASRVQSVVVYMRRLVGRGRSDSNTTYHSFPKYPNDSDEDNLENNNVGVSGDNPNDSALGSVRVDATPTVKDKIVNGLTSVRSRVTNIFRRRTDRLVTDEDDLSSISSDEDSVDRRAYGIFGEESVDEMSPNDCSSPVADDPTRTIDPMDDRRSNSQNFAQSRLVLD